MLFRLGITGFMGDDPECRGYKSTAMSTIFPPIDLVCRKPAGILEREVDGRYTIQSKRGGVEGRT